MTKRKAKTTPLDDARRAELGWILWTVTTCWLKTACARCATELLREGPLHG